MSDEMPLGEVVIEAYGIVTPPPDTTEENDPTKEQQ